MTDARCPTCGKSFPVERLDQAPSFPFCCERCRLLDLGRWLDEDYRVEPAPGDAETDEALEGESRSDAEDEHA